MSKIIDLNRKRFGKLLVTERVPTGNGMCRWKCRCDCGRIIIVNGYKLLKGYNKSCGCNRILNLCGQKFNRLTVISFYGIRKRDHNRLWNCKCDCGKIIITDTGKLRNGNTKSCGCLKLELTSKRFLKDLTGKRFGRLVVKSLAFRKNKKVFWECKCDCGNIKCINANSLVAGYSKSCGCLHKEVSRYKTFKDLTSKKFGRLTVIRELRDIVKKTSDALWECKCDCGNIGIWTSHTLNSGNTTSCGCYNTDKNRMLFQSPEFQMNARMHLQMRWMDKKNENICKY